MEREESREMSIVNRGRSSTDDESSPFDSFTRDLWDPFLRGFPLFSDPFFSSVPLPPPFSNLFNTTGAASLVETRDAHVMKAYVPGLKKEDVKVEVENGVVTVTVPKSEEERRQPERRTIEISGS